MLFQRFCLFAAGILLALFGGTRKHVNDRNRVPIRGDIHVLVVGESIPQDSESSFRRGWPL